MILNQNFLGQLDNSKLFWDDSFPDSVSMFFFHYKSLNFIKNNEYDTPFANGDTHFGWQLNPEFGLKLNQHLTAEAGIYLPYFFGTGPTWKFYPSFRIRLNTKGFEAIAGSLVNGLNHRLSEPLYEFENHLLQRQEYGLQLRYIKKKIFADLWLDWRNKIFLNDSRQEHFRSGYSLEFQTGYEKLKIYFPLQALALHYGGQLDTTGAPAYSDFAFVNGAKFSIALPSFTLMPDFRLVVAYQQSDVFFLLQNPKVKFAYWANFILRHKNFEFAQGYFYGQHYRLESGNPWMHSISFLNSRNKVYFNKRQILLTRFSLPFEVYTHFKGLFRLELIYDLNIRQMDYSMGLFMNVDELIRFNKANR
ncbi:MAG: hypothetical protein N3F09_09770 [Bacteroidia bacterium]|nr:hypothetical protein [Bacteroidia bacterium]